MMKRAITGCLAILLFCGTVHGQQKAGARTEEPDFATMAEDIEIMQRVITKTLQQHLYPEYLRADRIKIPLTLEIIGDTVKSDAALNSYLTARNLATATAFSQRFNVVGYYVPGTGVVFTLDFAAETEQITPEEDESETDLWTQIKGELRGEVDRALFRRASGKTKRLVIEQDSLDRTVDALIEAVGEYGSRIAQLDSSDSIILAARVSARSSLSPLNIALAQTHQLLESLYVEAMSYRVTISIPVSAVRAFEEERIDLDELKQRTNVTKYKAPSSETTWITQERPVKE